MILAEENTEIGVILVEGTAELFLLPAMAALRVDEDGEAINLDRYGITVCSVHGRSNNSGRGREQSR